MVTCSKCRNIYADFRATCPACGNPKPRKVSTYTPSEALRCASCDGPKPTRRCFECDEMVHAKCWERHTAHHAEEWLDYMKGF